jgi:hypothetical protein
MWMATVSKFLQNPHLKQLISDTGSRIFVEATEDVVWGIGWTLHHPHTYNPRKWRGPNLMGELLTDVRRYVRMVEGAPAGGGDRVRWVRGAVREMREGEGGGETKRMRELRSVVGEEGGEESEGNGEGAGGAPEGGAHEDHVRPDSPEGVLAFARKVLTESGDPDRWRADEWPGSKNVQEVRDWWAAHPEVDLENVLEDLYRIFVPDGGKMAVLEQEREESWYKACLYLIEGAVGLRRL